MKTVVILSTMRFVDNISAGVNRTSKYGDMLRSRNIGVRYASLSEFDKKAEFQAVENDHGRMILFSEQKIKNRTSFFKQLPLIPAFFRKVISKQNSQVFILYPSKDALFDIIVLLFLKILKRQTVFYEFNEVRKYSYGKQNIKQWFKYALSSFNEQFIRYFDGRICISEHILKYSSDKKKKILIPILTDTRNIKEHIPQYRKDETFSIAFAGSIDVRKENLNTFFESVAIMKQRGYAVQLDLYGRYGKGSEKKINALKRKLNLDQAVFHKGIIPQNQLISHLQNYHLLILPRKPIKQNQYGFSTKLSEYLLTQVPVLLTDVSDNMKYFRDGENVLMADACDPMSFADTIISLIDSYEDTAPNLGKQALETAHKHFDPAIYEELFTQFLFPEPMRS